MRTVLILILILGSLDAGAASLKLPALVSSHMVLQQQTSVKVWGWAKPGTNVFVKTSWQKKSNHTTVDNEGNWKLNLTTPVAGGPYTITVKADTTILLEDILIGEVWICSGQSNMQMPVNGIPSQPVNGSNDVIAKGKDDRIRLFTVKRELKVSPQDNCQGTWKAAAPRSVANFSAVGYFFGKYVEETLAVPVGLISTNWGGTPAESWTDEATLRREFREFDLSVLNTDKVTAQSPAVLFNCMIHPILNYTIRGVIWYQGESNAANPTQYERLFPAMINNWRERWNQGNFPFYFVQIAPYKYSKHGNSAYLREAQLKTMQTVPNTGMAVLMDIGEYESIHPAEKQQVGKRLAYWALAKTYGFESLAFSGPVLKEKTVDGNRVSLFFNYAENGFSSFGKELQGFTVAGDDKQFHPAKAAIHSNRVEVWSDEVKNPVSVRYCWDNFAIGTLFNTAGLPASSFRTDQWDN
jgi:sialate O-acetylesterase